MGMRQAARRNAAALIASFGLLAMAVSTGPASGAGRVWWFYWHKTQPAYQPPAPDESGDEEPADEEPADNGEPLPANSEGTSEINLSIERVTHTGDSITTLLLRVINRTTQPIKEPFIRCVAFDANEKALGIANGFVPGYLTPTGPGFAEVIFLGEKGDARRFASAKCSLDDEPLVPPHVIEDLQKPASPRMTEKPQALPRVGKDCSGIPPKKRTLDCALDADLGPTHSAAPTGSQAAATAPNSEAAPTAPPSGSWASRPDVTPADKEAVLERARWEISLGRPREPIVERLRQLGLNPADAAPIGSQAAATGGVCDTLEAVRGPVIDALKGKLALEVTGVRGIRELPPNECLIEATTSGQPVQFRYSRDGDNVHLWSVKP